MEAFAPPDGATHYLTQSRAIINVQPKAARVTTSRQAAKYRAGSSCIVQASDAPEHFISVGDVRSRPSMMNPCICGQVMRCISIALMPRGISTGCERATERAIVNHVV